MAGGFTLCSCSVVARTARTDYRIVVDTGDSLEACCAVTILTNIRGIDVACILARRVYPIVTRATITAYAGMIKSGIRP